jgi:hypothetical protein
MADLVFEWSEEKNRMLQMQRNMSFERIILAVQSGSIVDIIESPSSTHPNQKCFVVDIEGYAWLVPYVREDEAVFLKTAYPSRKHTKEYLRGESR